MRSLLLALLLAAPLAADLDAATHVVGPAGSGAAFPTVARALAAASPGDTIYVLPGTYPGFSVGLPVRIIGASSQQVTITASTSGGPAPITVRNLPAGGELVLAGMRVSDTFPSVPLSTAAVLIEGNAGRVFLSDLLIDDRSGVPTIVNSAIVIRSSALVVADSLVIFGDVVDTRAGGCIEVEGSTLWLSNSSLKGGDAGYGVLTSPGGHGIELRSSTLYLARSTLLGGLGGIPFSSGLPPQPPLRGGPALDAYASVIKLVGGPGTSLRGGDSLRRNGLVQIGAAGLVLAAGSTALVASSVQIVGGTSGDGQPGPAMEVDASSSLYTTNKIYPTQALSTPSPAPGGSVRLDMNGAPQNAVLPLLSVRGSDPWSVPAIDGALALDPAVLFFLPPQVLDATGSGSLTLPVPASQPVLLGALLLLQSVEVSVVEGGALSNPVLLHLN